MMNSTAKEIKHEQDLRSKLIEGVSTLSKAVSATLGPRGRNVILQTDYGAPHITKDGVTVASKINLEDKYEDLAVQIVKQAAAKTVEEAGDGTTTSIVLAEAIIREAEKALLAGANPIDLTRGINSAVENVTAYIGNQKEEVKGDWDKIKQIATISANGDTSIGELIYSAMKEVGADGVVSVQESKSTQTYVTTSKGMEFDRGYLSPYFINQDDSMNVELEDPYILFYDKKLRSDRELVPILEKVVKKGKPLLVIAEEVEAQALGLMVVNRMKAGLELCAVKCPAFGDRRAQILEDMATLTGGTVITEKVGKSIYDADISDLGRAGRVIVTKNSTTIINGKGDAEQIEKRIQVIRKQIDDATTNYDTEKNKERLAKMVGGVASIHIGAHTQSELKERKDRVDDALHATQAALEEGVVPGAGSVFIGAYNQAQSQALDIGESVLYKALKAPLAKIASNAGKTGDVVVDKVIAAQKEDSNLGYNAVEDLVQDLREAGVIDPAKVLRVALKNAASVANLIIMTNVAVVSKEDDSAMDIDMNMPY